MVLKYWKNGAWVWVDRIRRVECRSIHLRRLEPDEIQEERGEEGIVVEVDVDGEEIHTGGKIVEGPAGGKMVVPWFDDESIECLPCGAYGEAVEVEVEFEDGDARVRGRYRMNGAAYLLNDLGDTLEKLIRQ